MATLNEIVYNIRNIAYAGTNNSEQDLSTRQIKFWVHYTRAKLLKQMAANGKQLPYICFQNYNANQNMDFVAIENTDWQTYVNANTSNNKELLVISDRTANLAGMSITQYHNEDFYGRDFYNFDVYEDIDEYGRLVLLYPPLLNINNNYGFGELSLRYAQDDVNQNHSTIPIPLVSKDQNTAKKYNRFTSGVAPSAYTDVYAENNYVLIIRQLRSVFRESVGNYTEPIQYRVYANVCLQNPTEVPGWDDDHTYPIPQFMVKDLTQGVLQELQVQLNASSDKITDNADTTKLIQPQAHK